MPPRRNTYSLLSQIEELRSILNDRANKAIVDRNSLIATMDRAYKLSPMTDVLALNSVYQALQEKAVSWEYVYNNPCRQ